jgi:hypothetical protein
MKKRLEKTEHEMRRESRNFQRWNTEEQRRDLARVLLAKQAKEKADEAAKILNEEFWTAYNFTKKEGVRMYHILKKGVDMSVAWENFQYKKGVVVTVMGTGQLEIRLNPSEGNRYYFATQLSNEDLMAELDALKSFVSEGTQPASTSKFIKKITYDVRPEDIRKWTEENDVRESSEKMPVLKKKYHTIPSLSEDQKKTMNVGEEIDWWVKEELISYINNKKCSTIIIKKKIEGEKQDAYVREYIDGMPEKFKGKQLFTEDAAYNLWLTDRMPSDKDLLKMLGKRYEGDSDAVYEKNNRLIKKFIQDNGLQNIGMYSGSHNDLCYVDSFRYHLLLKNGAPAEIDDSADNIERFTKGTNKNHGYPLMLLEKKS